MVQHQDLQYLTKYNNYHNYLSSLWCATSLLRCLWERWSFLKLCVISKQSISTYTALCNLQSWGTLWFFLGWLWFSITCWNDVRGWCLKKTFKYSDHLPSLRNTLYQHVALVWSRLYLSSSTLRKEWCTKDVFLHPPDMFPQFDIF